MTEQEKSNDHQHSSHTGHVMTSADAASLRALADMTDLAQRHRRETAAEEIERHALRDALTMLHAHATHTDVVAMLSAALAVAQATRNGES